MAKLTIPKSQRQKRTDRDLRIRAELEQALADGLGTTFEVKKALAKKYKLSLSAVYRLLARTAEA